MRSKLLEMNKHYLKYLPHVLLIIFGLVVPSYLSAFFFIGLFWMLWVIPGFVIFLFLILVISTWNKKVIKSIKYFFGLFALTIAMFFVSTLVVFPIYQDTYIREFREPDIETGNKIIVAVQQYFSDNGKMPENLQELVPKYLPVLPKTKEGKDYSYGPGKGPQDFRMQFRNKELLGQCYNDYGNNKWDTCEFPI